MTKRLSNEILEANIRKCELKHDFGSSVFSTRQLLLLLKELQEYRNNDKETTDET